MGIGVGSSTFLPTNTETSRGQADNAGDFRQRVATGASRRGGHSNCSRLRHCSLRKQYPDSPKPLDHTFVLCRFSFSKIAAAVFACCYYFSKCPQSEQMGVGKTQLEFYVASVYIAWSSLLFLLQCPFHLEDNDLNQQFFAKERSSTVKPQTQNSLSSS